MTVNTKADKGPDPRYAGTLPLETDVSIAAEHAPLGVPLWPTTRFEARPAFTLAEVRVIRTVHGTAVTWLYEDGHERHFTLGQLVLCRMLVDYTA